MGSASITIKNRSGSFPYTLKIQKVGGNTQYEKATSFPHDVKNLAVGSYILTATSKEGICQPTYNFTINTINCNTPPTELAVPITNITAHCSDSNINILPSLPQGWTILSSSLPTLGTDNHDQNYSAWTYTPSENGGEETVTFVVTDGTLQGDGSIIITTNCEDIICSDPITAPTLYVNVDCNTPRFLINFAEIYGANGGNEQITIDGVYGEDGTKGQLNYSHLIGNYTYNAYSGYNGSDSFFYDISDSCGNSAQGIIVVSISCNDVLFAPTLHVYIDCDRATPIGVFDAVNELAVFEANPQIPYLETDAKTRKGNDLKGIQFLDVLNGQNGTVIYQIPTTGGDGFEYTLNNPNAVEDSLIYIIRDSYGNTTQGTIIVHISQDNCSEINCQSLSVAFVIDRTGSMIGGNCGAVVLCGNKIATHNYSLDENFNIVETGEIIEKGAYCIAIIINTIDGNSYGGNKEGLNSDSEIDTKIYAETTFNQNQFQILNATSVIVEVYQSGENNAPTCLAKAQNAVIDGIGYLDIDNTNNNLAVISFSHEAQIVQNFTTNGEAAAINNVQSITGGGSTNICSGLEMASSQLSNDSSGNQQVVILLTDGNPNAGGCDKVGVLAKMEEFKAAGIKVITIGLNFTPKEFTTKSECNGFSNANGSGDMLYCGATDENDFYPITYVENFKDTFYAIFGGLC